MVDIVPSSSYNNQAVFSGKQSICGCAGTGRQASLRCWCRFDVWVQVPSAAPSSQQKFICARVVELVDSLDSGSSVHYAREGSSPSSRTKFPSEIFSGGFPLGIITTYARVVELVDSLDSGSSVHYAREGSSPSSRTKGNSRLAVSFFCPQKEAASLSGCRFDVFTSVPPDGPSWPPRRTPLHRTPSSRDPCGRSWKRKAQRWPADQKRPAPSSTRDKARSPQG